MAYGLEFRVLGPGLGSGAQGLGLRIWGQEVRA